MKAVDTFIAAGVKLFGANPSQSVLTMTYQPKGGIDDTAKVVFRAHNAHLGTNYRFATRQSKDVSRLLNAMGPRGVSVSPSITERRAMRKRLITRLDKTHRTLAGVRGMRAARRKHQEITGIAELITNVNTKQQRTPALTAHNSVNLSRNKMHKKKKNKKR